MTSIFKLFLTTSLLIIVNLTYAQEGTIRGTVKDDANEEAVMFATVSVIETGEGTNTDLDGTYELVLAPGKYTIMFTYVGYADRTVSDVLVTADKVEVLDIRMKGETEMLEQVTVTATQIRNTDAALATIKKSSINLVDGLSSQSFKKTGDSNAGEALTRVTGVSVEGGKHVVVRGLGDRYTKTILNGVEIPGLDPDKNSVQMDLFPTNLIDNILVYKSFSPNLPGDFTGGAVDVITKQFPDKKTFSVGLSLGYNPDMHFKSDFLTYEGGKFDALGVDDGTRALPFDKNVQIPDITLERDITRKFTKSLNSQMAATEKTNNLDKTLSISGGNQINAFGGKLGYILGGNYSNRFTHFNNAQFNQYFQNQGNDDYFLSKSSVGIISTENVQWNTLGGVSFKTANHKIGAQVFHVQNADKVAGKLTNQDFEFNGSRILRDNLEYYQRAITNIALTGEHTFGTEGAWKLDWKLTPSIVNVVEPDIRTTGFDVTDADVPPAIFPSLGADINRMWRNLHEVNYNGRMDATYNYADKKGREAKLKFGTYVTLKERDYEILNYLVRVNNQFELNFDGNANNILLEKNLWTPESHPTGSYLIGNYEAANTFNATQRVLAGYVMSEMPVTDKLKAVYGVRVEKADNTYSGTNNQGTVVYNNAKVLNDLDVLPSVNLVYELAKDLNVRMSANRTVARPTFKEASIAQIQDRLSGRNFLGNIDIKKSNVNNFDLRVEKFLQGADLISASLFYKQFYNPIQLVVYSPTTPSDFQPQNLSDTDVYGFELEAVKSLSMINEALAPITVNANFTMVESTQPLIGLSPTILNTGLTYNGKENGWSASVVYNVQGRRLSIVGIDRIADVFDAPFRGLNLKVGKAFGPEQAYNLSFQAENLLNSVRQRDYKTNNDQLAIFDRLQPGRLFTMAFNYTLK